MAYARRKPARRKAAKSRSRVSTRRTAARRPVRARRYPARRRSTGGGRGRAGGGTVRIEVVHTPFEQNPLATALSETKKEIKPRRARL